ncbi:hypothetical protein DM01DRAFT_267048, partial [Hesseltinella vesiculosa]
RYARKSTTEDDSQTRIRLLQSMVDNLICRSLCTRVYVSPSFRASEPFHERDLNTEFVIYDKLNSVKGNTQDLLEYLQSSKRSICLIAIDFAGLSSGSPHVKKLLEENPSIGMIAIELFNSSNTCYLL